MEWEAAQEWHTSIYICLGTAYCCVSISLPFFFSLSLLFKSLLLRLFFLCLSHLILKYPLFVFMDSCMFTYLHPISASFTYLYLGAIGSV